MPTVSQKRLSFPSSLLGAAGLILCLFASPAPARASAPGPKTDDGKPGARRPTVLLVDGRAGKREPDQRAAYYVQAVLTAAPEIKDSPRVRTVTAADFVAGRGPAADTYDCIGLCDVPRLDVVSTKRLEAHLARGGGLVIFLGPSVDAASYNTHLYKDGKGLLPARLLGARAASKKKASFDTASADLSAPPLRHLGGKTLAASLADPLFTHHVAAVPAPGAKALLQFRDEGKLVGPALLERPFRGGRVLLVTTDPSLGWGSWPLRLTFPILIYSLFEHAATRPAAGRPPAR